MRYTIRSMKALLIDTSHPTAMLGLSLNGNIVKTQSLPGGKGLSGVLFPELSQFCNIKEISYISIGVGPGSYMGIRTAASIGKALAYALNIPLLGFPSPLALLPEGHEGSFIFIGDAKMGELYVVKGNVKIGTKPEIEKFKLIQPTDLNKELADADFVVGEGYLAPEPNLKWASFLSYKLFLEGNTPTLELHYLR